VPVGKKSFQEPHLIANALALLEAIVRAKPAAARGQYLRSVTLSSTMGPGIHLDPQRVANLFKKAL
jgi:large subunit ribosomal protein L1